MWAETKTVGEKKHHPNKKKDIPGRHPYQHHWFFLGGINPGSPNSASGTCRGLEVLVKVWLEGSGCGGW